jgi:ABC-type Fe3+ transport system substrate-binding protein
LASGEFSIGIRLYGERVEQMKSEGAPIEWVGIEPVVPLTHPLGVSAHAPHPNAARLFVDFMLSREGQEMLASFYKTPGRADVQSLAPRLKNINFIPFDETILDDYEKYVNLYRKMGFR